MMSEVKYTVTEHKGKNCIVRIHRPILTPEEQRAREEEVKAAIVRFYKEVRSMQCECVDKR